MFPHFYTHLTFTNCLIWSCISTNKSFMISKPTVLVFRIQGKLKTIFGIFKSTWINIFLNCKIMSSSLLEVFCNLLYQKNIAVNVYLQNCGIYIVSNRKRVLFIYPLHRFAIFFSFLSMSSFDIVLMLLVLNLKVLTINLTKNYLLCSIYVKTWIRSDAKIQKISFYFSVTFRGFSLFCPLLIIFQKFILIFLYNFSYANLLSNECFFHHLRIVVQYYLWSFSYFTVV